MVASLAGIEPKTIPRPIVPLEELHRWLDVKGRVIYVHYYLECRAGIVFASNEFDTKDLGLVGAPLLQRAKSLLYMLLFSSFHEEFTMSYKMQ